MSKQHTSALKNEAGIVSITVSVIFILVISLTVLGFSEVSRRNNRSALDRQLSSQAFYAAETGFNDAMSVIRQMVQSGQTLPEVTSCESDGNPYIKNSGNVRTNEDDNAYSCLLVDPSPEVVRHDNPTGSVVVPLNTSEGTLDTNTISWKPALYPPDSARLNRCPTKPQLPSGGNWAEACPYGLLRVDIMPISTDTIRTPFDAAKATMTMFIYPKEGSSIPTVTYDAVTPNAYGFGAPQGRIVEAACNNTECTVTVNGLNFSNAYMRMQMLYAPSQTISVAADEGEDIENSQVVIDVTGRSKDVLRRLQIRASITGGARSSNSNFADSALQSTGSICKRFVTAPANAANSSTRYTDYSGCPPVN